MLRSDDNHQDVDNGAPMQRIWRGTRKVRIGERANRERTKTKQMWQNAVRSLYIQNRQIKGNSRGKCKGVTCGAKERSKQGGGARRWYKQRDNTTQMMPEHRSRVRSVKQVQHMSLWDIKHEGYQQSRWAEDQRGDKIVEGVVRWHKKEYRCGFREMVSNSVVQHSYGKEYQSQSLTRIEENEKKKYGKRHKIATEEKLCSEHCILLSWDQIFNLIHPIPLFFTKNVVTVKIDKKPVAWLGRHPNQCLYIAVVTQQPISKNPAASHCWSNLEVEVFAKRMVWHLPVSYAQQPNDPVRQGLPL